MHEFEILKKTNRIEEQGIDRAVKVSVSQPKGRWLEPYIGS